MWYVERFAGLPAAVSFPPLLRPPPRHAWGQTGQGPNNVSSQGGEGRREGIPALRANPEPFLGRHRR
jgi:hypothetical protein